MVRTFPARKSIKKGIFHCPCVVKAAKGKARMIIEIEICFSAILDI